MSYLIQLIENRINKINRYRGKIRYKNLVQVLTVTLYKIGLSVH